MITSDYVNELTEPATEYLCPLNANIYDFDFTSFKIRALSDHGEKLLVVCEQPPGLPPPSQRNVDDSSRFIQYHFGPEFLNHKTIGTTLEFSGGSYEVCEFRRIVRD